MASFADFVESAMSEVSVRVDGEPVSLHESLEQARAAVAQGVWLAGSTRLVEFLDAGESVIETWTRTVES